jgi:hypothetical protein
LVELGPKALPFLLESLDDKTPTKLTVNLGADLDGMAFGHEIHGNPFNMQETKVLAHVGGYHCDWGLMRAETYTVRVGDICFIAIGQITNRSYNAVRYQPTNCMVVNSTSKDKAMAAEVRAIWGKSDYRRKLLDSLLIDFPGRGPFGDYLEIGAAMRLTYYFPEASQDTVVTRLKQLEPAMIEPSNGFAGKWYEGFVQAVSWSPQSKIRAELLELFGKTKDPRVLLAALPGIRREHDQLVFQRLTEQLAVLPKDEPGPYFDGYYLLIALGDRFPQRAEPVFQTYSKPGTIGRRRNLIHALRETCGDLSVGLLASLLEDKRNSGSDYSVNRDDNVPRLSIRVCDEAAETISKNSKTLKFVMEGSHQNLDRQIESMRQKIAEMKRLK